MEIKAVEIEISKVKLEPGQVLVVKVFADDTSQYDLALLKEQLKVYFPKNKIMLFSLPVGSKIEMDVLDTSVSPLIAKEPTVNLCGPEPTAFCNNCGCGKKEAFEKIGG